MTPSLKTIVIADITNFTINMDTGVTVIGNRRGGASGNISKERQLNMARRQGASVSTDSKYGAGGNRQGGTSLNTAKLDGETEELKHKTVDLSVGKLIAQGDIFGYEDIEKKLLFIQGDRPRRCLRKISYSVTTWGFSQILVARSF